ncbi:hypothetical protein DH2020_023532 [Rehmannia glutinosa]|uniref:Uncharacterized protein n=1 Tax=Rehmannia glutinosa TaxID=99300 RepID=A0ABR0W834_REHGL
MGTLNDCDMWPTMDVEPLVPHVCGKLPGRPKKNDRRNEVDEVNKKNKQKVKTKLPRKGVIMTCSLYHKSNHNARGCPKKKANQPPSPGLEVPPPNEETLVRKVNKRSNAMVSTQQSTSKVETDPSEIELKGPKKLKQS